MIFPNYYLSVNINVFKMEELNTNISRGIEQNSQYILQHKSTRSRQFSVTSQIPPCTHQVDTNVFCEVFTLLHDIHYFELCEQEMFSHTSNTSTKICKKKKIQSFSNSIFFTFSLGHLSIYLFTIQTVGLI